MSTITCKQAVRAAYDKFVQVRESVLKYFKDANPALVLEYFVCEDKYLDKQGNLDQFGYFYCKSDKLEERFGYTRKVQDSIIKKLVDADCIDIQVKRIEGSKELSRVRHIKVLHENIYNIIAEKPELENYGRIRPEFAYSIEQELISCTRKAGGKYRRTKNDTVILEIAIYHGLAPELIRESFKEKHKGIKGKSVTAKYLLTAYIPSLAAHEERMLTPSKKEKPAGLLIVS